MTEQELAKPLEMNSDSFQAESKICAKVGHKTSMMLGELHISIFGCKINYAVSHGVIATFLTPQFQSENKR